MRYTLLHIIMLFVVCLVACHDNVENVASGLNDYYYIERMKKLRLSSAYEGQSYRWSMKTHDGQDTLLSTERTYLFMAEKEGTYTITFTLDDGKRGYKHSFPVMVLHEETEYSPYTSKVYEYRPAPGQFVNTMPVYEAGDTEETMRRKAEEDLTNDVMITLGAWGGYVTFGFDHTVINVPGVKDFLIKGNAFYSDIPDYKELQGGSAEPGVVMVALDSNGNGVPDEEEWYELAGSEHHHPLTLHGYEITYFHPDDHHPVEDATGLLADTLYIPWQDNIGATGFLARNIYHLQNYWPQWLDDEDMLTFRGTRLPDNGVDESHRGTYYVLYSYPWGYADNHPNDAQELCSFDISWAVDKEGRPVSLPGIDFVRVYTGVNQRCGWLGETSTEVARARDLHLQPQSTIVDAPWSE